MNKQLRFFNPDNPPQSWSKEEGDAALEPLKAQLKQVQMDRIREHNVRKQREK